MSMAARAINSLATSSIAFAAIVNASALSLALVAAQLVLDRIHQRTPRRLDDIVRDADRPPGLVAVSRGDEDARLGAGALGLVQDADLVVEERHLPQVGVEVLEGLAQGMVERIDRPVARRRGVLGNALDAQPDGGLRHWLLGAVVLLDDHAVAVQIEVRPVIAERPLHQELERGLRTLELEALVLHALQHFEDA